jgi:hypothetical protein
VHHASAVAEATVVEESPEPARTLH